MKRFCTAVALVTMALTLPLTAQADIVLDYTGDTYFSANTTAKSALEAAVADINAAVDFSSLGAISNDVIIGTNGASSAEFDFSKSYSNPSSGSTISVGDTTIGAGEIRIFAGARTLTGTTLGQGGPGGVGVSASGIDAGTFAAAVADAVANEQHSRGYGPIISTLSGTIAGASYSFDQGIAIGSVVFDDDADWHFDHTVGVEAGKDDFYSVALHELLHAISYGVSDSWDTLVSGTDYIGAEGIAANGGSGTGLIDASGGHLASGTMSFRISDGTMQEAVMDPSITSGSRKMLTQLDLAVIRDLGFNTRSSSISAVPEPSSLAILLFSSCLMGCSRRRIAA